MSPLQRCSLGCVTLVLILGGALLPGAKPANSPLKAPELKARLQARETARPNRVQTLRVEVATVSAAEPIAIGSRRELFVDNHLVSHLAGRAELRLHRPTECPDVFVCNKPWEGNMSGYPVLFQDGDIYRMYYRAGDWRSLGDPTHENFTCYAESRDGVHWTRPELGLIDFRGSKKNNIILTGDVSLTFVPFKDTNPDCKPTERYKALAVLDKPTRGLHAFASEDGIRWQPMSSKPLITKGKFDSQNLAFWDPVRRRYTAYFREMRGPNDEFGAKGPQLGLDPLGPARDVLTSTSTDFFRWTEPRWLQYPESPRMQIYVNQIRPYYRAPHLFVGFPCRFMAGREIEKDLPITKHPSYKFGSITETLFMTSRDGVTFHRWGEAFVRPGPRRDRWIYAGTMPGYGLLVTRPSTSGMPDELSLYVKDGGGWPSGGNASRFRRYALRVDGFVSVQAPLSGGEVVTKPITFTGHQLTINLSTSAAGSVRVEIQDVRGQPVKGFGLDDCPEIFGDSLDRVIHWRQGPDVSQLAGRPVRLRFVVKDADLYSFQFPDRR